jgi:ribonuclease HI
MSIYKKFRGYDLSSSEKIQSSFRSWNDMDDAERKKIIETTKRLFMNNTDTMPNIPTDVSAHKQPSILKRNKKFSKYHPNYSFRYSEYNNQYVQNVVGKFLYIVYTDGGCLPMNPGGYATWAWVLYDKNNKELQCDCGCVGVGKGMTNNVAEYHAVIEALSMAKRMGFAVFLRTDSRLVVEQSNGSWGVGKPHLRPLVKQVKKLLQETHSAISWVPREQNSRADSLTEEAYYIARGKFPDIG